MGADDSSPPLSQDRPTLPRPLSPLDSLITPRYTRYILFFPLRPSSDIAVIRRKLKSSLAQTISSIPFLGASVTPIPVSAAQPRQGALQVSEPHYGIDEIFSFQDASSQSSLAYAELSAQGFPVSDEAEEVFTPASLKGYILKNGSALAPPQSPNLRAQMILLGTGFALCLAVHHSVMDGTGMMELWRVWAETCRTGQRLRIDDACFDTSKLMEAGRGDGRLEDHRPYGLVEQAKWLPAPPSIGGQAEIQDNQLVTEVVRFSASAILELKKASEALVQSHGIAWLSSSDILTALLWSATISARSSDLDPAEISTCYIAIDGRRRLRPALPPSYMHNAVFNIGVSLSIDQLNSIGASVPRLMAVAAQLRKLVERGDDVFMRDLIATVSGCENVERLSFRWGMRKTDCFANSLLAGGVNQRDWGAEIGGRCEAFRQPYGGLGEGDVAILPWLVGTENDAGDQREVEVLVKLQKRYWPAFWANKMVERFRSK